VEESTGWEGNCTCSSDDIADDHVCIDNELSTISELQFRCFAHVINLAVQQSLKILDEEISNLRSIIQIIRASSIYRDKWNKLSKLILILDCKTR
jgi:hypothetical protein